MRFPHFVICFTVLALLSSTVRGQFETPSQDGNNTRDGEVTSNIIEDDDDDGVLSRLNNVTSVVDFISLMNYNGRQMTVSDIFSDEHNETGKMVIQGGGQMAVPDECSPRDTTVRINFDNHDPKVMYFPRCTKVERCGGCCSSPHLACMPSYTERVSLKVVKAVLPISGAVKMDFQGFATVILDRHVTCRVECTLSEEKCGPKKYFLRNQCNCRCKVYERCHPPLAWDPETCSCSCAEEQHCCTTGVTNCGLRFNRETCECDLDRSGMHISNTANVSAEQIESYFQSLNRANPFSADFNNTIDVVEAMDTPDASSPTTTSTTTSTTPAPPPTVTTATTTTTAPTTESPALTSNPCIHINCPRNFEKVILNGFCRCRPRGRASSRFPRHMFGRR